MDTTRRIRWFNAYATAVFVGVWFFHLSLIFLEGMPPYFQFPMWYRWAIHQPLVYVAGIPAVFGLVYGVMLRGSILERSYFLAFAPLGVFVVFVLACWSTMSQREIADGGVGWLTLLVGVQMLSIWLAAGIGMGSRRIFQRDSAQQSAANH